MINIAELHKRKFFEINDNSLSTNKKEHPLVFANYIKRCMLIQNGEGYIPYFEISIISKVGEGIKGRMITELSELDELLNTI